MIFQSTNFSNELTSKGLFWGAAEQGFSDRKFMHDTVKLLYKYVCKYVYVYVDIFSERGIILSYTFPQTETRYPCVCERRGHMHIYGVINQKGGVGKTTTVSALAGGLRRRGKSVLAVDLDPQGNLTYSFGAEPDGKNALGVLTGNIKASEAVVHTEQGDIIPGGRALSGADAFITDTGKEYRLREALSELETGYDVIIIDTPPALGILTVNALTACRSVIIPAQADIYSLQGIEQLGETLTPVKKYCNSELYIEGILLTRYNPRAVLSRDIVSYMEQMAEKMGTKVFETKIREAVSIREAQMLRQDIFGYAAKSNVAADYGAFIDELLKRRYE